MLKGQGQAHPENSLLFLMYVSLFKGQFIPKPEIHISPLTCTAIYQSSLFWCDLPEIDIMQLTRCVRVRRPLVAVLKFLHEFANNRF